MNHRILRSGLTLLLLCLLISAPSAQQTKPATQSTDDRVELYQALLDLTNPWTVMCIAAHPDDEDGTSLIVMRHKYGAHTVSLFSTFGEGGQNAIGPELYEELGAMRARETMAAAQIQGSEPHFLGLTDFGFSKSASEAFQKWGHDEALRRMVLEIRKLRPDVIITNHSITSNDHGHHQATARLEVEAFDAAADPAKFPEQLKDGVTVWQVQRLFVRARGNQNQADTSTLVMIDPNELDPVRGTTFAEQALSALQKHATQGPWPKSVAQMAARFTGSSDGRLPLTRYRLAKEAKGVPPLPKDPKNFLDGLQLPENIARLVEPPTINGKPLTDFVDNPEQVLAAISASALTASRAHASELGTEPRVTAMRYRRYDAIGAAAKIRVSITSQDQVLVPGATTNFTITIANHGNLAPRLELLEFTGTARQANPGLLPPNKTRNEIVSYLTPDQAPVSLPHAEHLYDGHEFGQSISAMAYFSTPDGMQFVVQARVALDVASPVEIASVDPSPMILTPANPPSNKNEPPKRLKFTLKLINHQTTPFTGELIAASGITHERMDRVPLKLSAGEVRTMTVLAQQPPDLGPNTPISFMVQGPKFHFPSETAPVIYADARTRQNLHVGYVRGFDFSLPNALNTLGVDAKELTVADVKNSDLSKLNVFIVDNRVYESKPELIAANPKLLEFANAGGTVIVFYHKSDEWNPDERRNRPQLAPYKLILGNERITDENAPITFLEPDHPLLNTPNKMGQEDFAGWIQERGLYYPREWAPEFHALLQSNDPGEAPLKGGLLVTDYGRGHYIYTSMVWYRELRAGIPGAYRMLANMISYGQ
jgi:LmbE family N-acetylglucosaminyl deacetylase